MPRIRHILTLLALTLTVPAATAAAAGTQEASLQDNNLLIGNQSHLDQTLQTLKLLGVQRLRITVSWDRVAPSPNARNRPNFNAADPAAYPGAGWAPLDRIAQEAPKFGLGVNFDLTGGAPLWATRPGAPVGLQRVWYPSASEFGAFAQSLGIRYSGFYVPRGASSPLPRVNYWSIWNEPNVGSSSLSPQSVNGVEVGPLIYRQLLDSAYQSLRSTGHGGDTILVGELASTGHANPGTGLGMPPLRFLRALFCVDSGYRQLRGSAAAARGCPTDAAGSRRFRSQHPGLFNATGWSHHPYHVASTAPPNVPSPRSDPDWVTFAELPKLERTLDRLQRAYGSGRRYSIYLTEYGYNSRPPQSSNAVRLNTQSAYLNQAEYIAWRDRRVKLVSQYLLRDDPFTAGYQFSAFASGLEFIHGKNKPSFDAYRLPLWLPSARTSRGRSLEVWGGARPAFYAGPATHQRQQVQLQFQRGSRGAWTTAQSVSVNSRGYFDVHVRFPASGSVRLTYTYPKNVPQLPRGTIHSRSVQVTIH